MRKFLPRMFTIIVLFVYTFTIIFQQVPFLKLFGENKVFAEAPSEKTNLVLLLTDSEIYKGAVKKEVDWYAKDYIQANFVDTKAIILPLDIKVIKSYDIVKIIQNLYFDGQKDAVTDLQGIVLLGDIPFPVIEKNGFILQSIYPYVDIENPSFVYDEKSKYFKNNGKLGEAEIWHGVIKFDTEDDYISYFGKLRDYNDNQYGEDTKKGESGGAKMYLEDFQEAQNSVNKNNIIFYLNKTIWAEDISYGRITKQLLDYMKSHNEDNTKSAMEDFSKGLAAGKVAETEGNDTTDVLFGMDSGKASKFKSIQDRYNTVGDTFNTMFVEPTSDEIDTNNKNIEDTKENIPTKTLKSAIDKYTKNYSSLFGGGYGDKLRTELETTEKYSWDNTNSVVKLVDLKDKLSVDFIKSANTSMEKLVDKRVDDEEYYMKRLVQHLVYNNGAYWNERCHDVDTHWETFYFGLNAKHLEKARDLTILRGTYGNYESLDMMGGTNSIHKGTSSEDDNQGGAGTGKPIVRYQKPGTSYCGGGKSFVNVECGDEVSLYTIPSAGSSYEGDEGFLWKPVSESDGNLVILLPEKFPSTCNTAVYCKNPTEDPSSIQESGEFKKRYQGEGLEIEDDWEESDERIKKSVASSFGFNNLQTQSNRGYNFVNGGCQEDKMIPPTDLSSVIWLDYDVSGWEEKSGLKVSLEGNLINLDQEITTILSNGYDQDTVVGNPWLIFPKDCKRYATTFERMRPSQKKKLRRSVAGDHSKHFDILPAKWRPKEGVTYGFIVSGLARNGAFSSATRASLRSAGWKLAENSNNNIRSEVSWFTRGSIGASESSSSETEGEDETANTDNVEESGLNEEMIEHMEDKYLIDVERFDPKCSTVLGNYLQHATCTNYGKIESDEKVNYWAGRIFGGYSPINVNSASISGGDTGKGTSKGNLNQVRFTGAGGSALNMPICVSTGPIVPDGADYKKAWSPNATTKNGRLWDLAGTTALQECNSNYPQDGQSSNGSNYGDEGGAIRSDTGHLCGPDPQAYYSVDAYRNYKAVRVTQYFCEYDHLLGLPDWHFHNYPNAPGPWYDFVFSFEDMCPENKCEIYQRGDVIEVVKCDVEHNLGPYDTDSDDDILGSKPIERYRKYPCEDVDDDIFFNFWDTRLEHKSPNAVEFDSMEVATLARPIDTERYINFEGIGGDEVKLVYPDLWQVKVYNGTQLMSPEEIADEIELYLEEVAEDYIEQLETQLEKSEDYCGEKAISRDDIIGVGGAQDGEPDPDDIADRITAEKAAAAGTEVSGPGSTGLGDALEGETIENIYDLLEPLASPCNRDYEIPESDFLYEALGEETVASIAEMLYWMNLGWSDKAKQPSEILNRDMELDYYYDDFEVNEKIDYITKHITSGDPYSVKGINLKENVVNFPDFPEDGYDVGFVGSNGNEKLTSSRSASRDKTSNQVSSDRQSSKFTKEMMEDAEDAETCGVSSDGTVPLFDWPDAISCRLDQTLSKPFEIKNTSECSWSSDDELESGFDEYGYYDKENLAKVVAANKKVSCSDENTDILYISNKEAEGKKENKTDNDRYNFYSEVNSNLLIRASDTFFTNDEYTGHITIEGDTNNLDITAYSDGITCLWLQKGTSYKNLCDGISLDSENNWKYPISFYNLDTNEGKDKSTKAGDRYLNFKICKTSNENLCIWKTIILEKVAGDISYIEINPYSDSMIWGGTMPVVIKAYDQNPNIYPDANEVTAVPYSYNITIDPSLVNIYKGAVNISDTTFARDEKVFWLKAANDKVTGVDKFTLNLELSDEWKEMYPNVLEQTSYTFNIYSKEKLEDNEITLTPSLTKKYRIPKDPYDLASEVSVDGGSYGIYSYDKDKLVKLNIKPTLPDGSTLKNTVTIKDINGIFVPGNIKDTKISVLSGDNKLTTTYPKFNKKEKFLINSDGGIDIWLVPTLRTGLSKLRISIPGMEDYYLYYNVYSPGVNDLEFTFEEPILEENGTTMGHIKLLDALGNIATKSYEIDSKGTYSDTIEGVITLGGGLTFDDGSNIKTFETSDGLYEFSIMGKESGYATVAVTYYDEGKKKTLEKSQEILVKKTAVSLDENLNMLYLSIFGTNWWKNVKDISVNSDKNLAITTMIEDPKMLKQYNFVFNQDFRITDNIGVFKKMFFEDGEMKVDLGKDKYKPDARFIIKDTIDFKVEQIENIEDIPLDDVEQYVEIYYLPEPTDDIVQTNNMKNSKLYINGEKSIDIETGWQSNNINIVYDIIAHEDYGYSAWKVYMGEDKLLGRFFIKSDLAVKNAETYVTHKLDRISKEINNIYTKQISSVEQIENEDNDDEVSLFYLPITSASISKNYMNSSKVYIAGKKTTQNPNLKANVYIDIENGKWNKSIRSVYDEELYIKYGYPAWKIYLDNTFVGTFFLESKLYLDNYTFLVDTIYGEGTTNGIKGAGFYSYEHDDYTFQQYDSVEKFSDPDMKIGFVSDFRNITDWAGGETVGEATRKYSSEFVINFGDPLLKTPIDNEELLSEVETSATGTVVEQLEEKNTGFLDYDSNLGDKIFTDMRGSIKKVLTIDFNKDGLKDFIIVYNNNSIRLLKQFKGTNPFKDIGDLMIVSGGIKDVFVGDATGDGFEDIFVLLKNNSFRYYKNQIGKFDLQGLPVCLDIYGGPDDLNIEQIYAKYIDDDKKIDFLVNDKNGTIKTFYGDTYLSTDKMKCDAGWKDRLKQETIKDYSIQINKDVKFIDDGYIYRSDLDDTESNALTNENKLVTMEAAETRGETLPLDQANYLQENKDRFAYQEFPSEYGPAGDNIDETTEFNFKKAKFLGDEDPITIYKTIEKVYEGKEYDGGILSGDITILKASDETNITDYVLYWGASSYEKLVGYDSIATIPVSKPLSTSGIKTMKYTFDANTKIPKMATHILVYTKNDEGEMVTGKGVVILQMGIPRKSASAIGFTDITINNSNTLSGKLRIIKAQDESNITDYVLYWGSKEDKKLVGYNPIAIIKKTGDNLDYDFSSEIIPEGANYILVYSKNRYGEDVEGIGVQILEKKNATIKAGGITFLDTDPDGQEIEGIVNIKKASNESNIEDYVLYWGLGEDEKLEKQPIKNIPKTGGNLKYIFGKNTKIPEGATHLLVYTKSKYGEMFEAVSTLIEDKGPPQYTSNGVIMTEELFPGDVVKITVHLKGNGKKFTYLEALKGPFEIQKNQDGEVPLEFDTEDKDAEVSYVESYPKFIFKLDNFSGREVSYYAKYKGESPVNTVIDDTTGNIKMYTNGGCSKGFEEYDGNSIKYTDLKEKMQEKVGEIQEDRDGYIDDLIDDSEAKKFGNLMNKVESVGYNEDETFSMDSSFEVNQDGITISDAELTNKFENFKEIVDDVLGGLCKGFGFGAGECGNISIPCNMAFLSPGITNICGCPLKKDYGMPIFYYPGTLYVAGAAIPVPNMLKDASTDDFYWVAGGKYSSFIRIYLSPTLTQGLGLAVCFGDYGKSMEEPVSPFGTIMGNCIVVAGNIPLPGCNNGGGEDSGYGSPSSNSDNTIEDWMNDLLNMGSCSETPGSSGTNKYSSTALSMGGGSSYSSSSMYSDMPNGTVEIDGETAVKFDTNAYTINSQEDVDVLLEAGEPITLKIQSANSKGLIKCIIQSWWNRQLEFIISNFTSMTVYIIYPDLANLTEGFGDLFDKLENVDTLLEDTFDSTTADLKAAMGDFGIGESSGDGTSKVETELSKITPAAKGFKTLGKAISNPFENLKSYFESIPLVDMQTQTLVVQMPWIGKDEISRQIAYLKGWKKRNKEIIKAWKSIGVEVGVTAQFEEMLANVDKNIEILYKYVDFPKEVYKYLHLLDYYLTQIMCIIEKLVNMVVGRLDTNSRRFEKWVDTIILLIAIIDTWQILIDFSVNWKTSCGQCKQDNADLHDCILSIFCFDLPVLPIPPFKIPDITIDLSHINLGIDILLPELKIKPVAIKLFQLPDLPEVPPIAGEVIVDLPEVPLLPEPPDLNIDLFELPEVPYVKLPNLPPAPELPQIMPTIKVVLNILKVIGRYYCIIKNGIGLVSEWDSKSRIEQLTQRRNRVDPFDFLKINFPSLPYKGVDLKIDGYLNFRVKLDQIYELVEGFTEDINDKTNKQIGELETIDYEFLNIDIPDPLDGIDTTVEEKIDLENSYKKSGNPTEAAWKKNVHSKMDFAQATQVLYDELDFFIGEFDEDYMKTTSKKLKDMAIKVQNMITDNKNVQANKKGVKEIGDKVTEKLQEQKDNLSRIEKMLKRLEQGKLDGLDEYKDLIYEDETHTDKVNLLSESIIDKENTIYKTPLFTMDKEYLNVLENAKSPKVSYLEINKKMLSKLSEKIDKKLEFDSSYMVAKHKVDKTLNLINSELQVEVNKKNINYVTTSENNLPPADPTNNIRGLYVLGEETENYYSVMSNKDKAQEIRKNKTYFLEDVNGDDKKDIVWWDSKYVYIKYKGIDEKLEVKGESIKDLYAYKDTIKNIEDEVDDEGYIKIEGNKFKIWSQSYSNSTLQIRGQDSETVRLTWEADINKDINAYLIVHSDRIDILNDIEKKYNYNSDIVFDEQQYKGGAVLYYDSQLNKKIIPKEEREDTDFTEVKLPAETEYYDIFRDVGTTMEIMPVRDFPRIKNHVAILDNVGKEEWTYFRVYPIKLTVHGRDKYEIENLSMYSNQVVGGSQVSSDDTPPEVSVTLRKYEKVNGEYQEGEIVGEGLYIDANVNTRYVLDLEWYDNLGEIRTSYLLDDQKRILCKNCSLYGIENSKKLISSYPGTKTYYLIGEDQNNNITNIELKVNYQAPSLSIRKVDLENGRITAEFADNMDKPMVKFLRERDGKQEFIENENLKDYFTGTNTDGTEIIGSTFDTNTKITFYKDNGDKSLSLGWLDTSNGEVYIYPKYSSIVSKAVDFTENEMNVDIYGRDKVIYRFNLPGKKLVEDPVIFDGAYKLQAVESENMGNFNNGWCILDIVGNQCATYISPKGNVYVPNEYKNLLIGQHSYDKAGKDITIEVYKGSLSGKKLFEWSYELDEIQ